MPNIDYIFAEPEEEDKENSLAPSVLPSKSKNLNSGTPSHQGSRNVLGLHSGVNSRVNVQ